jgi:alanine dehydrogenase
MLRVCPDDAVASVLDLAELLPVVADAFRKQAAGAVERPDRPHFPVGTGLDVPEGTALTMPAYLHRAAHYATKLVAVHDANADRGLPTVNAQIALTRADDGQPAAFLAGTRITNARTGCIGGLAARELATGDDPLTVGVLGAGQQARWQARAIATATDVASVRVYSPNTREACAADLREHGLDATAVESPADAVADADVVVTATTSTQPVFDGTDLSPGTLVVAVGAYTPEMRELDAETVERAARVFADVPEEAAETGDLPAHDPTDLIPFADVVTGDAGRQASDEILVVASVGTAILDAAAAEHVYDRAQATDAGVTVPF